MFENVLPKEAIEIVETLSSNLTDFYLAGGTGLALQLGHRKSVDLDFFSPRLFNTDVLLEHICPHKILLASEGTLHCEIQKVKFSFLFYKPLLIYPLLVWRKVKLADWKDITAEKFKTIAQRGSKKDFYDLYAVIQMKLSIEEACRVFKERFTSTGINMYHVMRSLVFFEDAQEDPEPIFMVNENKWKWEKVKNFFEQNITHFEKCLME